MREKSVGTTSKFETDATTALELVRKSMAEVMKATGQDIHRPTDVQKSLGLDSKLSWQVFNVIHERSPLAAAKLVPGEPSLERFIKAAVGHGVPQQLGDAVREAVAEFGRVVELHAEDRAEFDFMASSVASDEDAAAAEMAFRRIAFRAESHLWGLSVDTSVATTIVRLSGDGTRTDECTIANKRGCRRLRPGAPRSVLGYRNYGAGGAPSGQTRVPLDAKSAERFGAHLMPGFCSQPIPSLRTWQRPDGYTSVDVQSDEIGRQSSVSFTFGHIFRSCPLARGMLGEPYYHADMRMATPARVISSFLLVHRPSFGVITPDLRVFRMTPGDDRHAVAESAQQVLTRELVRLTGTGRASWQSPDLERHDDMVQAAFDELGWNPAEFDTYNVRIEYPVLHSVVRMQFPLRLPEGNPPRGDPSGGQLF